MNQTDLSEQGTEFIVMSARKKKCLRVLLIFASIMLIVGLIEPMITLEQFVWLRHSFSVVTGIWELIVNGQFVIALLISCFSVLLPFLKINTLYRLLAASDYSQMRLKRYLALMHDYGRWAMLDVMVVAVLIVTVKLGMVASIQIHFGFFLFTAAVITIMLVTELVVRATVSR